MAENLSELLQLRQEKLSFWKAQGKDPFGQALDGPANSISSVIDNFQEEKKDNAAGRIVSFRDMGKSIFGHLTDETGRLQFYANKQSLGEEALKEFKQLDLADIIYIEGELFITKTGEKTLRIHRFVLLTKTLRPLPSEWYGLNDSEARYRQRYVDLLMNEKVRNTFLLRSQIIREMRTFLEGRGFLEVETPMMQTTAGGAAAEPFKTHHNALDIDLYLRIAPELYLKRLLVGGFTKVFEVNRNFRNEGISRKHNPEFTMLEAYWAYANFEMMAALVEEMVVSIAEKVLGTLKVKAMKVEGSSEEELIDLSPPWKRRRYEDCIRDAAGEDWFELSDSQRKEKAKQLGLEVEADAEDFEVTQEIFEKLVEARQVSPLFVTHLPKQLVPLAKQNAENPDLVDVYELIINRQEISPGYTELNDPIVQRQRLEEQAGHEKQKMDEEFLLALEHGMPPAGGIGIGVDRLVMMLTESDSIRDVILFPLLRPKAN